MTSLTQARPDSSPANAIARIIKRWACLPFAVMMLMLGACSDEVVESATSPDEAPVLAPAGPPEKALTNASDFAALLSDAQARVLPAMPDSPQRDSMVTAIDKLAGVLLSSTVGPVAVALEAASKSIDHYAPALEGNEGAQADLDAIRLTMNAIATQLASDKGTGQ